MGQLLQQYLANFGPSLAAMSGQDEFEQPGQPPQGGAQTFPMGAGPKAQPLQRGQPTFRSRADVQAMQPPPGANPSFSREQAPAVGDPGASPGQSFGGPATSLQTGATPTFQPPAPAQVDTKSIGARARRRDSDRLKAEDVKTFDDLMEAASPEEIEAGIKIIEQQVGGPEGLSRAYAQVTGQPPSDDLTREEKGMLLMEFGLRTLAYNDTANDSLSAIGRAGSETLGLMRGIKQEKRNAPAAAREAELKNRLIEAQIKKAESDPTEIKSDKDGRLVLINKANGSAQIILDGDGNPVSEGKDAAAFASQMDRDAYSAAFCEGLTGDAAKRCQQQAVAFSKGGATEIAFPELQRQQLVLRLMTKLEDTDNEYTRYTLPDGTVKRWRDMGPDEQLDVTNTLIDKYTSVINQQPTQSAPLGRATSSTAKAPTGWEAVGMTEEQAKGLGEGMRVGMRDPQGKLIGYVANRGGKLVRLNTNGSAYQAQ